MKKNYVRFTESVSLSLDNQPGLSLTKIRDDYSTQQTSTSGLQIRIAATHAGIITRNNGFYIPDKMKKGATSFVDHYPKPILLNHKSDEDPVGRIVAAEYVDTSGAVADSFKLAEGLIVRDRKGVERGVVTDLLLKDFVEGKMSFGMQVDTVISLLRDSLLDSASYEGLGHIQIVGRITDQDAINKLLDKRYLTGSVGATTDRAVCSVCRQDWTDEGPCEHKPGGIYDETKCFIIAGALEYDEYSFVNVPADRHSKVLELHYNGIHDKVEIANDYSGRIYEVHLGFPQYDSVSEEEGRMAKDKKDAQARDIPEDTNTVIEDSTTPEPQPVEEPENTEAEGTGEAPVADSAAADADVEDKTATEDATSEEETPTEEGVSDEVTTEETFDDFLTRVLDAKSLTDEEEEKLYEMMCEELGTAIECGEACDCKSLEDAKLSTEKRKKLASSKFCGPGRSFPVPDCAHVTAARRLIGRYKGPGDKSKILACVSRKAKALGCSGSKKKDSVQQVEQPAPEAADSLNHGRIMHMVIAALEEAQHYSQEPVLEAEEVKTLQSILKRLATLVGKDQFISALVEEELALSPECEKALVDEVAQNEETIGELRDELGALRKEYNNLFQDVETLQDALAEATLSTRKSKEAQLSLLRSLQEHKVEDADLSTLADGALDIELGKLVDEVDIAKITDKLGDGMSRTPTDEVDDPTTIQDTEHQKSSAPQLTAAQIQNIQETWMTLLWSRGQQVADAYVQRLKKEGILPSDSETK